MTPERAAARVARLEARLGLPADGGLGPAERAELEALELERAERFPTPIDGMSMSELDAFASFHASDVADRLGNLRERAKSPQERAADRAMALAIGAMSLDELDEYMLERTIAAQEESHP